MLARRRRDAPVRPLARRRRGRRARVDGLRSGARPSRARRARGALPHPTAHARLAVQGARSRTLRRRVLAGRRPRRRGRLRSADRDRRRAVRARRNARVRARATSRRANRCPWHERRDVLPGAERHRPRLAFPPKERWDDWVELDSRSWPERVERRSLLVPTTCFNCESACGLLAYVDQETLEVRKFEGNPEHPGSRGRNCAKGPATLNQITDPDRILIRSGGPARAARAGGSR